MSMVGRTRAFESCIGELPAECSVDESFRNIRFRSADGCWEDERDARGTHCSSPGCIASTSDFVALGR